MLTEISNGKPQVGHKKNGSLTVVDLAHTKQVESERKKTRPQKMGKLDITRMGIFMPRIDMLVPFAWGNKTFRGETAWGKGDPGHKRMINGIHFVVRMGFRSVIRNPFCPGLEGKE